MSERSKSLENILGSRAIPKKEDDTEDVGPCASRPANKFVNCLHVHDGPRPVYSFQYSGIGVRSTFEPGTFAVWFLSVWVWLVWGGGGCLRVGAY